MQNNTNIIYGITFLDRTDLDSMIDLKYRIGNELIRCHRDKVLAVNINEDLLALVCDWADKRISDLVSEIKISDLKVGSPKRKRN